MKHRLSMILLALVISISAFLSNTQSVLADMPWPDSDPEINEIHIFRNLLAPNDRAVFIYANIPYAESQNYTIDQAFIFQLLATDNTTVLGSAVGYPYNDRGFGWNVFFFYFSAADNLTWDITYPLRLVGTPAAFTSPPVYYYEVPTSAYTLAVGEEANQEELAELIIDVARALDISWGLSSAYSLISEVETGAVLSIYGESFFRGAIYGLQGLCPQVFSWYIADVEATPRTWGTGYSGNITNQWSGTWVEHAMNAGKSMFGLSYDLNGVLLIVFLCCAVIVADLYLTADIWPGLIDCSPVMVIGAKLGFYDFGFLGLITSLLFMYLGVKLWYGLFR